MQVAQSPLSAISATGSAASLWIGRNGSGNGMWRGKLDDLRIWNIARSGTDIAGNFRTELATSPSGLVGNWKFDEASGTVAADTTALAENATLSAGTTWSPDVGNGPPPGWSDLVVKSLPHIAPSERAKVSDLVARNATLLFTAFVADVRPAPGPGCHTSQN